MELLINFDNAIEYYDLKTQNFIVSSVFKKTVGFYKVVIGGIVLLFVENGELFLGIFGKKYLITDDCTVELEETGEIYKKRALLFDKGSLCASFPYESEEDYSKISPFEYLDEEDSDWGLFLKNIVNNKVRKRNFIQL